MDMVPAPLVLTVEENIERTIIMKIKNNSLRTTKTHVPVFLAKYGDENLVSRSQAKRLLTRLERFEEIVLDFEKVETIGQAFADEIFRVFQSKHPTIEIIPININEQVSKAIYKAVLHEIRISHFSDKPTTTR